MSDWVRVGKWWINRITGQVAPVIQGGTLPAQDTFTGTDGTPLPTYSSNWSNTSGQQQIENNSAVNNGASAGTENCSTWVGDTFDDDHYAQCVIAFAGSGNGVGVSTRGQSGPKYYGFYGWTGGNYLFKNDGGSWTQLGSTGDPLADSDVIKLESVGNNHTPYLNGSTTGTPGQQNDSSIPSGGGAGLSGWGDGIDSSADDFEGDNISSGTAASSEQTFYLAGKDSGSSSQVFFLVGVDTESSEQVFYLDAVAGATGEQLFYLAGVDTGSGEQVFFLVGSDSGLSEQTFYLDAEAPASSSQIFYLAGVDTGLAEQIFYLAGEDSAQAAQTFYLDAVSQEASSEQAFYLAGEDQGISSQSFYLEGMGIPLIPDGDVGNVGSWKTETGGTSNYYQSIDEQPSPIDSDYDHNDAPAVNDYLEVTLSDPPGVPGAGDVIIWWRANDQGATGTLQAKMELREGTTIIASDTRTLSSGETTFSYTLTSGEKASISNWNNLRLRVWVVAL